MTNKQIKLYRAIWYNKRETAIKKQLDEINKKGLKEEYYRFSKEYMKTHKKSLKRCLNAFCINHDIKIITTY